MSAIILICACKDDDRAHDIRRRLVAEGHDVRITHRPEDNGDWKPDSKVCTVALWSNESKDCWPIREMARTADAARALVHVALEPVTPPIAANPAPIDLSRWSGERTSAWRLLRERIERVERGEARTANPFYPTMAMTAVGVTIVGFAILLRMEDGAGATQNTTAAPVRHLTVADLPKDLDSVGGPLESQVDIDTDLEVRLLRVQPLRPVRMALTLPDLETPRPLQTVEIRRPSLLRQIMRVPEHLPFVGDTRRPTV